MPLPEVVAREVRGFRGVNLRRDRVSLADEQVARAINLDFHAQAGAAVLRLGRSTQFSSALADLVIRRLAKINSRRYQVAGTTVYRAQTSVLTGLSANLVTTLLPFRPLNDTTTWAFLADDALMRKDDGTNVRTWGIAAPTATPGAAVGAAGSLTGDYSVKFTYVRKVGASVAHESNPSPASTTVTLSADVLDITGLTASSDPQVTHKRIYRTQAGGTSYLFDQEVTNATTTATSTKADTALGTAVETDNDLPPEASFVLPFQEHVFLLRDADNPHYLWWTKRFRPESVPPTNFVEIGSPDDPLQAAATVGGLLGVFARTTKYLILGNVTSGFVPQEAASKRGTPAWATVLGTERGIVFLARDGLFLTTLAAPDTELSDAIAPLFSTETGQVNGYDRLNWSAITTAAAAAYKGRLYVALPHGTATTPDLVWVFSPDTGHWYAFDHPARALFVEEDTDTLTAGFTDGLVYILEDGTATGDAGSGISLEFEKDGDGGAPSVRKFFRYVKVDADTAGQDVTVQLYVDGTLKRTFTYNSSRAKELEPYPERCIGYHWRVRITYTGTSRVRIYGVAPIWLPVVGG